MRAKRRAYSSRNWKITTPKNVVSLFWQLTHEQKDRFDRVLDMGAGDGRFARGGHYQNYVGIEIDPRKSAKLKLQKVSYSHGCVFEHKKDNYSACIGNPPYLRHNEISDQWRTTIQSRFSRKLGLKLDGRSNLYVYFLSLGLQKTSFDGIVSVLIPYEWAFIPSARPIRDYIDSNRWSVFIYRLAYPVFDDALTTVSISIINKSDLEGGWRYFDVDRKGKIVEVPSFTDDGKPALGYEERGKVWGMRGLSPGKKRIFTLSEGERIARGLTKRDVRPCVTSLRELPKPLKVLDRQNFNKHFVLKNKKCWLLRTDRILTEALTRYVRSIPKEQRSNWTCLNQKPWYKYKAHPSPKLLMSSAFKKSGPRILLNSIKAVAVGSVIGIHSHSDVSMSVIHKKLRVFDFNSPIVSREQGLKKIAVKQLNAALNHLVKSDNGK